MGRVTCVPESALHAAVGSATRDEHELVGRLEMHLLVCAGLQPDDSLVDIGCGSGRLAVQLADWLRGPYLGTDVVQSLLDQAAQTCRRPDWRFERVRGLTVPAGRPSSLSPTSPGRQPERRPISAAAGPPGAHRLAGSDCMPAAGSSVASTVLG